jgi:hypothetical protein
MKFNIGSGLIDIVEIEDSRTQEGESYFKTLVPLRNFRGNYGVPRRRGDSVIKGFFSACPDILEKLSQLQTKYHQELSRYIPTVDTNVIIEENLFYLTQPFLEGVTFQSYLQGDYSKEEKIKVYGELLFHMINLIDSSEETIGIDGKPENWLLNPERGWVYIDTFPPFLLDGSETFEKVFNLRGFEKQFVSKPNRSFFRDKRKISRRFWIKSEKFEPELDYLNATIGIMKDFDTTTKEFFERMMGDYK